MMRPIPFPILLGDRQPHIVRAPPHAERRGGEPDPRLRPLGIRRRPLRLCRDERFARLGAILPAA